MVFFHIKVHSDDLPSPISIKSGIVEIDNNPSPNYEELTSKGSIEAQKVSVEEKENSSLDNNDFPPLPSPHNTHTQRTLKERQIQFMGMGGTIGTAIFVQIGQSLVKGGPANLVLAFIVWCIPIMFVTSSTAEMVSYLPIPSPFVRLAGRCLDEAFEVMAGWNFFLCQAILVPCELTAVNTILHYWVSDYSPAIPITIQLVLYCLMNVFAVQYFGESEFWLALGKVLLAVGLIFFTFIVAVGGNPQKDAFGFRTWKDPGAFNEYVATGNWGRFLGFFACLVQSAFTIVGPEYISMAAGEAANPRRVLPKAYKAVFYRITIFFVLGALSVGVLCPYNDPVLLEAINSNKPKASASPYVIAMTRMKIRVLPHIVNFIIMTAAFSGGNSYVYCSSRTLYGLAAEGRAPKVFSYCTKNGVPIFSVAVSLGFGLLSFLQLGATAFTVLSWMASLITVSTVLNFGIISLTYIRFYEGLKAQGIDRNTLPYRGWFQPYGAWIAFLSCLFMTFFSGWSVFVYWDVTKFIFSYVMIPICALIYFSWKLWSGCKFAKASMMDLTTGLKEIEEYESTYVEPPPSKNLFDRFFRLIIG